MNRNLVKKIIFNFLCLTVFICGIFIGQVKVGAAPITVSFFSKGGNLVASQTGAYGSTITAPIEPTKTGHTFEGWYKEAACKNVWNFITDTIPANDVMLYANWNVNTYLVDFDSQGGNTVTSKTGAFGRTITEPTAPTRTGYTFDGWYKESACINVWTFSIDTVPANNVTLYAKWTPNSYTVAFDSQGGSAVTDQTGIYGSTITEPSVTRTGYTYSGWYKEAVCTNVWNFSTDTIPPNNITLHSKWIINSYTVSFDIQSGSTVASQTTNYDSTITVPLAPTKTGYIFGGWFKEVACTNAWNFETDKVTVDTSLYAKWSIKTDYTAPVISGVTSQTIALNSIFNPLTSITATDNLEGNITNKIVVTGTVNVNINGVYKLTYTVSDISGNVITATRTITVDNTAPIISGTTNQTIVLNSMFNPSTGVTATDKLDGNITNKIIVTGTVNVNANGVYILTYTVSDRSGNVKTAVRTITVDNTAPVISGITSQTIALNAPFNPLTGVVASDKLDGNITNLITVTGSVNVSVKGIYKLTYTVSDRSGNVKTVVRTITVDNVAPVIIGATSLTIALNSEFNPLTGVTGIDKLDGNITNKIVVTGTVNVNVKGVYKIVYTVSDNSGNIKTVDRTITVKDYTVQM